MATLAHEAEKIAVAPPMPAGERSPVDVHGERVRSLRESLKRAQRNGNQEALERVALSLHDTGEDALAELITALKHASPERRAELMHAAASYGDTRVAAQLHAMDMALPEPVGQTRDG